MDIEILGVDETKAEEIEIYPNPAHDACCIRSWSRTIHHIELFDSRGKSVKNTGSSPIANGQCELSLDDFPTGVYTLRITFSDQSTAVRKLTVH